MWLRVLHFFSWFVFFVCGIVGAAYLSMENYVFAAPSFAACFSMVLLLEMLPGGGEING